MPVFNITSPDGKEYKITAPEGATKEQVLAYAQAKFRKPPTPEQIEATDIPSRMARGAMDPISGLAQIAHNVVPEGVRGAINTADQWLHEKTGGLVGSPYEDFNARLKGEEQKYQQARQATGQTGFDAARSTGNVATTIPALMAAPTPQMKASLLSKTGYGAAAGGLLGMTNPVYEGDFSQEKMKQSGAGMLGGAVAAPVAAGLGRVISPQVDKAVRAIQKEGITPSPGQIMGGAAKAGEEKLRSVPILGDFITSAHRKSAEQLNRAAYNRALNPIGVSANKFPVGREGVTKVKDALSDAYNKLIPKLSFKADPQFISGLGNLRTMAGDLEAKYAGMFEKVLKDKVISRMTPQGNMSGVTLKKMESELGIIAKKYGKDPSAAAQMYSDAINEIQNLVRQTVTRANPAHAAELKAINSGYANYAIIRSAASKAGTQEGFTAAQLANAAKAADKSVGQGATATGKALMQDLTDAGTKTLTNRYPDSGSIGRLMLGGGALGAGAVEPTIPAALFGGGLAYTQPMQKLLAGLLTKRPPGAQAVSDLVRTSAPALGPGIGGGLLGLYE